MYEGLDTTILYEELAYQGLLPLTWQKISATTLPFAANQHADRNLRTLQAWVALEDVSQAEKPEEKSPHAADMQRLDMKVNLLLDLVGKLLAANERRATAVHVRFNAIGAAWRETSQTIKVADEGLLEIYLRDCLVEPLRLNAQVTSVNPDGLIKVKFHPLSEAVADLIEKIAFQRHRRQVAEIRQPRAGDVVHSFKLHR